MHDLSEMILSDFQVRKTKKQKEAFRELLSERLGEAGFAVREERLGGLVSSTNVIIGDVEKAQYVFTAHYDTCAVLPVPNFIAPRNIPVSVIYQLLLAAGIIGLSALIEVLIILASGNLTIALMAYSVILIGLFLCLMIGPANRHTANDNTSGVIVLVEALLSLPPEARDRAAFVFFDNEELGLLGSAAFKKKHGKLMRDKTLINFDCVSDGDHLLLAPSKALRRDDAACDRLERALALPDGKTAALHRRGLTMYPSDQMHFPRSVGVVALRRMPIIGYYLSRIHTPRDTCFDRANIEALRAFTLSCITGENPLQ